MNGNIQRAVLIHLMLFLVNNFEKKHFFAAVGGVAAAPAPTTHCGPAPRFSDRSCCQLPAALAC